MIDTSSNFTCLSTSPNTDGPSVGITYKGHTLNIGPVSDRTLDSFIYDLTNCLSEMIDRRQRHGNWETYEYERSMTHCHLRGLMKERARRLEIALRIPPVAVVGAGA